MFVVGDALKGTLAMPHGLAQKCVGQKGAVVRLSAADGAR
jgi:hypothetical protein